MSEIKFGDILLPGDEQEQAKREAKVRKRFWPTIKRAVRVIPFSRDLVAAYYCALDKETPLRVRGILLGALAYFVLPIDTVPDFLAVVGFSDDIAVLTAAFTAIKGHIKDRHYVAADKALSENLSEQA